MKKGFGFIMLVLALAGCRKDEEEQCAVTPDASAVSVDVVVEQWQDSLSNIRSKAGLVQLFSRQPMIRDYVFRRTTYPDDSVFLNTVFQRLSNPHFDSLAMETKTIHGDLSTLRMQFAEAFRNLKFHYPDFIPPKVKTVISGMETDLFVSDSLIIVSLDFFHGPGAKYRPQEYEYILRQYKKENIVPSCMLIFGINNRFNNTDPKDKTVLADMITYGKAFYFAKQMLPCVPDSTFMWYTPEEIKGSRKNQDLIWARLIQDKVLYSTSHVTKQKYLQVRPKTLEVGEECPGRIAQWVGWQIVNSFMQSHPQMTLTTLMSMNDAQTIFKDSRYRPQRK
jgi:hypothetical protein